MTEKLDDTEYRTGGISTKVRKDPDDPQTLNITVTAAWHDGDLNPIETLGSLEGFIIRPGYLPTDAIEDEWLFDRFDCRSAHATQAFEVLCENQSTIGKLLGMNYDDFGGILFLERIEIVPTYRGNRLSHRLMREARHVFNRFDDLVMLKAHPDGDSVGDEDCRKLARYYSADPLLGLKALSDQKLPGWLVAQWDNAAIGGDEFRWEPNAKPRSPRRGGRTRNLVNFSH